MRILVVGSTGLLGTALIKALGPGGQGHEILAASRSGQYKADLTDAGSIEEMYRSVGKIDAVACAAGSVHLAPLSNLTYADFQMSLQDKLLGQMELVRQGLNYISDEGSFTLVSGITAYDPIKDGSLLSTINAGLDGFVRGAAVDLPRGIRINSVSATIFEEAVAVYGPSFPGFVPSPASEVARAFVKSVEGVQTGQTYRVGF